jgi:hypothetical protein
MKVFLTGRRRQDLEDELNPLDRRGSNPGQYILLFKVALLPGYRLSRRR